MMSSPQSNPSKYKAMRWIVITSPDNLSGEVSFIERLFYRGLDLLHLRKPAADEATYAHLLEAIPEQWHSRIVLHDHFQLTERFALHGVHLNRRNPLPPTTWQGSCSASCHSLSEVTQQKSQRDYLFLSPIFNSISKVGYAAAFPEETLREAAHQGIIDRQVIALGGITATHIPLLHQWHFGGAAFLGDIWGRIHDPAVDGYLRSLRQSL